MKYVFIDCRLLEGSVERHNPFLFLDEWGLAVGYKLIETGTGLLFEARTRLIASLLAMG